MSTIAASENKIASIRKRIDMLSRWLEEQESASLSVGNDDSLLLHQSFDDPHETDAAMAATSWSDIVAAATGNEQPAPNSDLDIPNLHGTGLAGNSSPTEAQYDLDQTEPAGTNETASEIADNHGASAAQSDTPSEMASEMASEIASDTPSDTASEVTEDLSEVDPSKIEDLEEPAQNP